jgi:hypothetical protein
MLFVSFGYKYLLFVLRYNTFICNVSLSLLRT